jgi:endoglucanase
VLALVAAIAVLVAPVAAAASAPPGFSSLPLGTTRCVAAGGAVRIDPHGRGSVTLDAQGLRANEPVDVLLNTEAGATLLARRTTSASGALCNAKIPVPPRFVIHNSRVPGGEVTVPLHEPLEEYQLSIIGETHGDGFSLELPIGDDTLQHPVGAGTLNLNHVADGVPCPKLKPATEATPRLATPLTTTGRWIVDSTGRRVKLSSVSWYGGEAADFIPGGLNCQTVTSIAQQIHDDGFNSVRLPWSNAALEEDPRTCSKSTPIGQPCVSPGLLTANPSLRGQDAIGIDKAVVAALGRQGVMVILDDHTTDAEFCCAPGVFNGLWWGGQIWDDAVGYGDAHWQQRQQFFESDWSEMADRFEGDRNVIGADLRNEPSGAYGHRATWDGTRVAPDCQTTNDTGVATPTNWEEAAQETSSVILSTDPNLLIFVEGLDSSTNLSAVFDGDFGRGLPLPLCLNGAPVHKLVYSSHDYQWDVNSSTYDTLVDRLNARWGKILTPGQPYTAPIWVGEFGGCDTQPSCTTVTATNCPGGRDPGCIGNFFEYFTQYLAQTDVDWGYWALNGTRSNGGANVWPEPLARQNLVLRTTWTWFQPSVRGVFGIKWQNDIAGQSGLLARLRCIQPATQGPGRTPPSATPTKPPSPACPPVAAPTRLDTRH